MEKLTPFSVFVIDRQERMVNVNVFFNTFATTDATFFFCPFSEPALDQ